MNDTKRCGVKDKTTFIDIDEGNNPLFNILNAVSHFSLELESDTGYCQGMNFVGMFLFKTMSTGNNYNEVDIFFIFVHIT